jgi:hypothetical protein
MPISGSIYAMTYLIFIVLGDFLILIVLFVRWIFIIVYIALEIRNWHIVA